MLFNGEQFETYFPKPSENGGFQMGHIIQVDIGIVMMEDSIYLDHDIVLIKFAKLMSLQ